MTEINRYEFVKLAKTVFAAVGAVGLGVPFVSYFFPAKLEETPSEPVPVGPEADLEVGKAKKVRFGRYPAIVVNTEEGLKGYSAVCTHFACICDFNEDIQQIVCPCHEGYFDPNDGHVISGPPPRPLDSLKVEVVDGTIYVGGDE